MGGRVREWRRVGDWMKALKFNWKVTTSSSIGHLAGPRDPTSLQGYWGHMGQNSYNAVMKMW